MEKCMKCSFVVGNTDCGYGPGCVYDKPFDVEELLQMENQKKKKLSKERKEMECDNDESLCGE